MASPKIMASKLFSACLRQLTIFTEIFCCFVDILGALSFEFQKFRILAIFNFHHDNGQGIKCYPCPSHHELLSFVHYLLMKNDNFSDL